ncbi:MAG: fumarylacetoacetate hydrolase family protein [bacterium]|nr:fumarylacetoacetate hydrolase family protein [bacterium]
MTSAARTVRVFRESGSRKRLLLDDGVRLLDLSAYLMQKGQPTDLLGLFEAGWFDAGQLNARLPAEDWDDWDEWTPVDIEWDGNAPPGVDVPIDPRDVGKILALGKNYRAHAEEFGEAVPAEPMFFNKLPETLVPHGVVVDVPAWYGGRFDHEAELAVVIGLGGRDIAVEDANEHVAGYTVANDLTLRSLQGSDREKRHPWFRAKNSDGTCPLGPCFVPRDFLDISDLRVTAQVGETLRQDASTRDLVVDVPHAIAALSRHLTLHPGDLILTGTPAGVGPLADGEVCTCAVAGIGELTTTVRRTSHG